MQESILKDYVPTSYLDRDLKRYRKVGSVRSGVLCGYLFDLIMYIIINALFIFSVVICFLDNVCGILRWCKKEGIVTRSDQE